MGHAARVWGFLVKNWVDAVEAEGGDVESAFVGAPFTRESLGVFGARPSWDDLALLGERLEQTVSAEILERSGERHVTTVPLFRDAARALRRPSVFYGWLLRSGDFVWPVTTDVSATANGMEVRVEIPAPLRTSRAFFLATVGTIRAMPRILGQPDATVVTDLNYRTASYRVTFAQEVAPEVVALDEPRGPAAERFLQAIAALPDAALRGLALGSLFELLDAEPRTSMATRIQRTHGLTRAESRVAARLAEGARLSTIASELEVGLETVRTHLRNTFRKTGVRRQAELVALVLRSP